MAKKGKITPNIIKKMVKLSKLTITKPEYKYFTKQFNETLNIVNKFNELKTKKVNETSHVTGLINNFREDIVEKDRMLTQEEALSNAKKTHKGYFVVKAIFDEK